MQKEIEVKAKVADLEVVKAKLQELGCAFAEPVTQEDHLFVNFDGDYTVFMPGTNFLRIRKMKDKTLFTLKQPQSNELDCIEKEVQISDAARFKEALELMGYHEVIVVVKTRMKTKHGELEICLDEVKDLGSFIEVEKMAEGEVVQKELFDFLKMLGIQETDRVMQGYDNLLYLKMKGR